MVWNCVLYCHGAATLLSIVGHRAVLTVYRVRLKTPVNAGCSSGHSCNCWYSFEAAQFHPCTYVYSQCCAQCWMALIAWWLVTFWINETRLFGVNTACLPIPTQKSRTQFPCLIYEYLLRCRERGRFSGGVVVLREKVATNSQRQAEIFFSVFRNIPSISVRRDSHIVYLKSSTGRFISNFTFLLLQF